MSEFSQNGIISTLHDFGTRSTSEIEKDVIKANDKFFTIDKKPVSPGRIEKMSKSKKNVVDPNTIVDTYGSDTARFFILSDSPPQRDMEWTDAGVEGASKFLNKVNIHKFLPKHGFLNSRISLILISLITFIPSSFWK